MHGGGFEQRAIWGFEFQTCVLGLLSASCELARAKSIDANMRALLG